MSDGAKRYRFNVIDLIVLLALLAAIAGVGWKMLADRSAEVVANDKLHEVIVVTRVKGVYTNTRENISIFELPLQNVSGQDFVGDASLVEIAFEPFEIQGFDAGGAPVYTVDPNRWDVLLTEKIKTDTSGPVIKHGTQELRVNYGHTVKTKYFELTGTIESIVFSGGE